MWIMWINVWIGGKGAGMRRNIYKIITCLMIIAVLTSTTTIPLQAQQEATGENIYGTTQYAVLTVLRVLRV